MSQHSKYSPSGAASWTVCTAGPDYIEQNQHLIPEDTSTEYSRQGTIAHDWAAKILNGLADISEVPEDIREPINDYVEFAEGLVKPEDETFIESRVPLFYRQGEGGTVDYCLVSEKRIYVLDLKFGQGVIVEAKGNKQLAIYARSMIEDIQTRNRKCFPGDMLVIITIFQPRTHEENPAKIWSLTIKELWEFTNEEIVKPYNKIMEGETCFAPDDKVCQFCDAKGFCKARQEFLTQPLPVDPTEHFENLEVAKDGFTIEPISSNTGLYSPKTTKFLSNEQIAALCKNKKAIEKLLSDVWAYAQNMIEAGHEIPGLKVVKGREGNRTWKDEKAAETFLKKIPAAERYVKTLLSPTQAEKKLKSMKIELSTRAQNRWGKLVYRPPGKQTLAFDDDPRESIAIKAEEVFENLDEEVFENLDEEVDPLS